MFNNLVTALPGVGGASGTAPVQGSAGVKAGAEAAPAGEDFGSMLSRMATDTIDTIKNAESVSVAGIKGKASTQQVVESIMAAEQSLQTALAIRDKAVAAYQEVSRMTI
jgi:flagellar hook-basal body complex protein FliE